MFETNPRHLSDLVGEIGVGKIQLPDFQRGWVWDDGRIQGLLTSVIRQFPVGAIMMLENGGDLRFASRPIYGADVAPDKEPDNFILDGQQRLTSLFQTLASRDPVETRIRNRKVSRTYFVDIRAALGRSDGPVVVGMPETRVLTAIPGGQVMLDLSSREKQFENHMISTWKLLNPTDWPLEYIKYWESHDPNPALEMWMEFNSKFVTGLSKYLLPVITLTSGLPREAVCSVFEHVNTGGIVLTAFELLTATLAAEGFNLRDDWEEREARLNEDALLKSVGNILFLQVVALLSNGGGGCDRSDILKISRADYERWASEAEKGFVEAANFLKSLRIFQARDLPYAGQLVSLAALYAQMGKELASKVARERLEHWYWSGVFGEEYGSTTATRIVEDVREVPNYVRNGRPTGLMNRFYFDPLRVVSLRTRGSAAYKGLFALQMKAGCVDWLSGEEIDEIAFNSRRIDIHHIFPKAWFSREGAKKYGGVVPSKVVDSSVNKAPLTAATNQLLGANAPSTYVQKLEKNNPEIAEALTKSFVRIANLEHDDFVGFFIRRACELVNLVYGAAGKDSPVNCHELMREHLRGENLVAFGDDYEDSEESDDADYPSRP